MPKTIRNRKKRLCMKLLDAIKPPEKICRSLTVWWVERICYWFVLCDLQTFSDGVYYLEKPHAQSLFSFSNSYCYYFVFRWEKGRWSRASDHLISVLHQFYMSRNLRDADRRERVCNGTFKEIVNGAPISAQQWWPFERCGTKGANFGKGKSELNANFSATMVKTRSSLSLSLSLSLSVSVSLSQSYSLLDSLSLFLSPRPPHAQFTKRFHALYNECAETTVCQKNLWPSIGSNRMQPASERLTKSLATFRFREFARNYQTHIKESTSWSGKRLSTRSTSPSHENRPRTAYQAFPRLV